MGRYFLFILATACSFQLHAQSVLQREKDTVKIAGAEMVIRNQSSNVNGYLFNAGNGKTAFRKIGKAMQFSVGVAGFPQAGDTVYTSTDLANKHLKVWRNGLLQRDGVKIDTVQGKIIFYPALIQAEKIYIEAFNKIDFSFVKPANSRLYKRRKEPFI
jgi:hypothetical protein